MGSLQGNDAAAINLQIGGLVTSMQRSFLGDISPPVSVLVADTSLGNSLITSSDFTNIDEYFNGEEDTLNSSQFNRYTLQDVVKDRNFLEKLTAYDDSLFTKDADIEKIDVNQLLGNSSGNSTLQSSMSSSSHTTKADETFTPDGNATFNATIGDANRTYLQIVNSSQQNATFNANAGNATFDAQRNQKPTVPFDNRTEDLLDDESMILSETFGIVDRTFNGNATVDLPINGYLLQSPLCSPLTKTFPTATEDVLASTPSRQLSTHYSNIKNTTISKMDIDNISPISCEEFKFDKHLRGNCTYSNSPTIEALQQINVRRNKTNSNLGILNLRDEERRSLTNFEEFENTLSLLENNQDEAELDDLLNSIGHVPQLKNEKIRQSLDNIKKRHSLINLEKQQLDEQKRLEVSMHRGGIGETTAIIDRQRMNDSINKLMMSSSGSGERLLRRSRLNDDAMMNISSEAKAMNKSAVLNETITQSTEANNRTMNMEELHSGGDNRLTNTNNTYSQNETYKTESNETEHNEPEVDRSNRDRFKTIRIFKRPPENAKMVPDIDDSQSVENIPSENQYDITQANEHFTAKNTNSPKLIADAAAEANDTRRSSSVSGLKRSALVRPKYLSGIAKRETSTRSSSQEILSSNDSAEQNMERKPAETLKSPMGVKAKSIHNLASSTSRYTISHGNQVSALSIYHGRNSSSCMFSTHLQRDSRPASRDLSLTRTTINGSGNVDLNKVRYCLS